MVLLQKHSKDHELGAIFAKISASFGGTAYTYLTLFPEALAVTASGEKLGMMEPKPAGGSETARGSCSPKQAHASGLLLNCSWQHRWKAYRSQGLLCFTLFLTLFLSLQLGHGLRSSLTSRFPFGPIVLHSTNHTASLPTQKENLICWKVMRKRSLHKLLSLTTNSMTAGIWSTEGPR